MRFRRKLQKKAAQEIARLAEIPVHEEKSFYDALDFIVNEVWQKDPRAVSAGRSADLVAAAKAALKLNRAICTLNKQDIKRLIDILKSGELTAAKVERTGKIEREQLSELIGKTWAIAADLSTAAGVLGPPPFPGVPDHRPGVVRINDFSFELVVGGLRSWATEYHGSFTFSKSNGSGTLLQALEVLRPHLPDRVIPRQLPLTTIERIVAAQRKASSLVPFSELQAKPPQKRAKIDAVGRA
jgi:hypothetical protein